MLASVLDGAKTAYLAVRGFATPAKTRLTWTMPRHAAPVSAVVFFKDSRRVVTGSDHVARIWDVEKGALVAGPFEGHWSGPITCPVAVSPDDKRVASGSSADIMIWDVDEQKVLGPLVKHQDTGEITVFLSRWQETRERVIGWNSQYMGCGDWCYPLNPPV